MGDEIGRSMARLFGAGLNALVLISAPAGCGKTTFARAIAATVSTRIVRLRVDPAMTDTAAFLTALSAAFRAAMETPVPSLAAEDLVFADAWLNRLVAAVADHRDPVVLILDDLHGLRERAPWQAMLAGAMTEPPDGFHLILVSRIAPDPVWLRFQANGVARRIDARDLLLDLGEAADLIAASDGAARVGWTPEALVAASGGWMLGARLLLQAPPPRETTDSTLRPAGDDGPILDLIGAELLDPLPARDIGLLIGAEILSGLPATVVAEAIGGGATRSSLVDLARRILFVDIDDRDHLHVHDLLRAAIRNRYADRMETDASAGLRSRAAHLLIVGGDRRAGLAMLASASAWAELVEAVDRFGPDLAAEGDIGLILTVLGAMPEDRRRDSLIATYWYGVSLLNLNPVQARQILWKALDVAVEATRAEPTANPASRYLVRIWVAVVDSVWLEWVDCTLMDPLLALLPLVSARAKTSASREALARGAFAALSFRDPAHPDFADWEARSAEAFWQPAPRHEAIRRGIQLLFRYCWGEGARAKAEQVRGRLSYLFREETAPLADVCTRLVVTTEFLSLFEPSGDLVFAALEKGLAATERHKQRFWDVTMINAALYRAASMEDRNRFDDYLQRLAARLGPSSNPNHVAIHEHFIAYGRWLDGENEAALGHALTAYRLAVAGGFSISPVYYGLAVAAILSSLGRRREALSWLRAARRKAAAQKSPILTFMAGLRGAEMALQARGPALALAYLRPALAAGQAQRFMVHPWLRLEEMASLLGLARAAGLAPSYVDELSTLLRTPSADDAEGGEGRLRLRTMGTFDVVEDGVSRLGPGKAKRATMLLALHLVAAGPDGLPAEALADRLWSDCDPVVSRNRLKSAVYRLRQLFGLPGAVRTTGGRIALDGAVVAIDAWDLERLVRGLKPPDPKDFARAMALFAGTFASTLSGEHAALLLHARFVERLAGDYVARYAACRVDCEDWEAVTEAAREGFRRFGFDARLWTLARRAAAALDRPQDLDLLEDLGEADVAG